ncbi:MAG: TIGR01458 family HAD-type hydrolase [Candidatus Kryptoniota bacterium]
MKTLNEIKGWLIDLEGTLYAGDKLFHGAKEFIEKLRAKGKNFRFISNTNVLSRKLIAEKLQSLGIAAKEEEIFTASSAAAHILKSFDGIKCYFAVADNLMEDFKGIESSDKNPDYVVMGDVGTAMNYELMNKVFNFVMAGSELIALQKNKFVRGIDGLQIDAGAFVTALEYAADKEAKIIGKPSRQFFNLAVHDIRVETGQRWLSAEFAMVGDDIESDIKGAIDAGLAGILVKTGKYNDSYSAHFGIVPDLTFDSISDLSDSFH